MGSTYRMGVLAQIVGKGNSPKKGQKCARTLIIPLLIYRNNKGKGVYILYTIILCEQKTLQLKGHWQQKNIILYPSISLKLPEYSRLRL